MYIKEMDNGSLYVQDKEICHRKNVPSIMNKNKTYRVRLSDKIKSQGMTSTVYYYRGDSKLNIIKHSDKEYMTEQELIDSVGVQMIINKELNMAPEVVDFFMCDNKPKQCVLVMEKVGIISLKDHMKIIMERLVTIDKINPVCLKIYENILHFYTAIKWCNYVMNYQLGIIHGDLHCGNIQLDLSDETTISKIYYIDFDFSKWIYRELDKIALKHGTEKLNLINYYNNIANRNNLHVCKMILDYCNELMMRLTLYNCPFGTPLEAQNSIKITNSDDIQSSLQKIYRHYTFTSRNPICGLLVLLMNIYDLMYEQFVVAPFIMGQSNYLHNNPVTIQSHIESEMSKVWNNFTQIYGINYEIDTNYKKLVPKNDYI